MRLGASYLTLDRSKTFDFSYSWTKATRRSVMRKSSKFDFNFLIKPLRTSAWWALFIFLVIFFILFFTTLKCFGGDEETTEKSLTFKILVLTFWTKFILIFAYYGGAITTDLTVDDYKIPFETYAEVKYKKYIFPFICEDHC